MKRDDETYLRLALLIGVIAGVLLAFVGCAHPTARVAGHANDYAYLFARGERVCGKSLATVQTAPCHDAARALIDYKETLQLADDAVGRKGPFSMTETQLSADRKAAKSAVKALGEGVIP